MHHPVAAFSCLLITLAHLYFAILPAHVNSVIPGIIGYIAIGVSYSLFGAASWPMIPYVVDEQVVGTAYGIAFACENMGSIFGPLIIGRISDANKYGNFVDYRWVSAFLAAGGALGFLTTIALMVVDIKDGGVLMSSNAAERFADLRAIGVDRRS